MRTRRLVCALALLLACTASLAAPNAAYAGDHAGRAPAPVQGVVGYVGTFTATMVGALASSTGDPWADSTIHLVGVVYQTAPGEFQIDLTATGDFTSWAGISPNGTGTIEAGVTGSIAGGASFFLSGPPMVDLPEDLGTYEIECDREGECSGPGVDIIWLVFGEYDLVDMQGYSAVFSTCDGRVAIQQQGEPEFVGDITGGPAACKVSLQEAFDGLYAYINPGYMPPAGVDAGPISPRDVCYIISTQGPPSGARIAAVCDRQWPSGPRPGWSNGAVLLASGPVYIDGSSQGYWKGDPVVQAFSPNAARLPLFRTGEGSYLYKENCHHLSRIGEPLDGCK